MNSAKCLRRSTSAGIFYFEGKRGGAARIIGGQGHIFYPWVMNVKKGTWKTYAFWILLSEGVGALSGFLTREGSEQYARTILKPALSPPSVVFPIVWGILFVLMGIGAARIYLSRKGVPRTRALALFVIQLAFNFFWSIIFFNFQLFGLALVWLLALWVLIVLMTVAFYRVDRPAGLMQLPYLLWVTFALYLNGGVWLLN